MSVAHIKHCNREKMEKKKLHYDVFMGKTEYIPLIIDIPCKEKEAAATPWECMHNPELALKNAVSQQEPKLEYESDFVPFIESNFMECLIPSLFGAEAYESEGGLIDVKPIFDDVEDVEKLKVPDLMGGMMPQAIEHLRYIKEHAPEWMLPQISRMYSPLDAATVMRGGDFYLDIAIEPEITAHFLNVLTETAIGVAKILKDVIGQPMNESVTIRGIHFPGVRITNDAIVNLSPNMIQEMYFPCLKKFKKAFGEVMLHYCCAPAPSGHVLPALNKGDYVRAVDNWQGFQTFFNKEEDMLQDKIAICTDLPFDTVMNFEEYTEKTPFFSKVKRNGGRGLTVTTVAPSEEDAKRLWNKWQRMQGR